MALVAIVEIKNIMMQHFVLTPDPPMQIQLDMDGSTCLDTHKMMIATFVVKRRSVLSEYRSSIFFVLK